MSINKNLKLSIILPIYNVEIYLEKCIRSLEKQDIPNNTYEIICVNDGSPDKSKEIIENLQKEFLNIILINQSNKGVSIARNVGINNASGDYLLFVDPDDAIKENCLKDLLNYVDKGRYEVVFSPFTFVEMNGKMKESRYNNGLQRLMIGPLLYKAVRGQEIIDPDRSVAIIYQKKFILNNNLFYFKDIPYLEDGEFIARVLCLTKRGSVYNEPYYLRLNRPGSATKSDLSTQLKSINGFLLASKNLLNFKESSGLTKVQKEFLNQPICKFVVLAVQACAVKINYQRFKYVKRELKNNFLLKLDLKGCNTSFFRLGKIYNFSRNYFFLYLIINHLKKYILIKFKY